jgi:hypothetical protein
VVLLEGYTKKKINLNLKGENTMKIEDIIFNTRRDAEEVLGNLADRIDICGRATVKDLCNLANIKSDLADHLYGWTYLKSAYLYKAQDGYCIWLPKPIFLGNKGENTMKHSDAIFKTREEAHMVLGCLDNSIQKHGCATLAELYFLIGINTNFIDAKMGWTDLSSSEIKECGGSYHLYLPKAISLEDVVAKKTNGQV